METKGDPEAQQGIRFNTSQLNQSYQGDDERLNIGPKGFMGEKYGDNTQWNIELCCVPYFLLSTLREVYRRLLLYRYNQLPKAIKNACKLGFTDGTALYPMVTIHREEYHNEWGITFEEIHRNNVIVYAIMQYARITGNKKYIAHCRLEVMTVIYRLWSQWISYSQAQREFVLLGVTGPNEYENNTNNNWYTNFSRMQCLQSTIDNIEMVTHGFLGEYVQVHCVTRFNYAEGTSRWQKIIDGMYLPRDEQQDAFIQDGGYSDKEPITVDDVPANEWPINQWWSWDRILRSRYIKQDDVLLGLFLYYESFDHETILRNFRFYEPRTVHESSLPPSVHAILAAWIGGTEEAYCLFLHATRLDLDDYNNEVHQGLRITSMAGSWQVIVHGFVGIEVLNGQLDFNPTIPQAWDSYTFKVDFYGCTLQMKVEKQVIRISLLEGCELNIRISEVAYNLKKGKDLTVPRQK